MLVLSMPGRGHACNASDALVHDRWYGFGMAYMPWRINRRVKGRTSTWFQDRRAPERVCPDNPGPGCCCGTRFLFDALTHGG